MVQPKKLTAQNGLDLDLDFRRALPIQAFYEDQFFQLALMDALSPTGVSTILEGLTESRFNDVPILVNTDGSLLLKGNADGLKSSIKSEDLGHQIAPSFGAVFFDGEATLIILSEGGSPPGGWVCVGLALTPSDFWEQIGKADLNGSEPSDIGLPRIRSLGMPAF